MAAFVFLVPVIEVAGPAAHQRSDAGPFSATRNRANGRTAGCADSNTLGGLHVPPVPHVRRMRSVVTVMHHCH